MPKARSEPLDVATKRFRESGVKYRSSLSRYNRELIDDMQHLSKPKQIQSARIQYIIDKYKYDVSTENLNVVMNRDDYK